MAPLRSALPLVVCLSLLTPGCAVQTSERRMAPEPAHSVQQELGYADVVRLSHEYAIAQGYDVADIAQAERVRPNYWRVRFGLAPKGSGKLLDLEFDEAQQRIIGSTEVGDTAIGGSGAPITPVP